MARASKADTSEDIWHLSIDDLLAAPEEPARAVGAGPFVINLRTSTESIGAAKGLRVFEGLHVYELRRGAEGQEKYALRVGIIETEVEADSILSSVLEHYPAARKESADDDDRAAVTARKCAREAAITASRPVEGPAETRASVPPAAPPVLQKPEEPFRWDVDEILPDLAVTRPSRPRSDEAHGRPVARPRVRGMFRTPAPAAAGPVAAGTARVAAPSATSASVMREPPRQLQSESLAATPAPSVEIELSAPAPTAPAPTPHIVQETDYDSDAITQEVEIPTFTFDAPEIDLPVAAAAPKPEPHSDDASPIEPPAVDEITVDPSVIDPATAEAPAIESRTEDEITVEVPAIEPAPAEEPTIDARELDEITVEVPAIEPAPAEEPTIDARELDEIAFEEVPTGLAADETLEATGAERAETEPLERPALEANAPELPAGEVLAVLEPAATDNRSLREPTLALSPPARVVEPARATAPFIDSTQTIRALTPLELEDDRSSPWYSIQLALSEEQIDPEQVPNLDIYNEYRLYVVTGLHGDRIMHALRLGFFSSERPAEAVAGYLRAFFDSPCLKRVSVAERERFAEMNVTARKDVGATGMHAVIELASPAPIPERHTPLGDSGKRDAPRSVWSRLVSPLKR